jgi:hypothetical protein
MVFYEGKYITKDQLLIILSENYTKIISKQEIEDNGLGWGDNGVGSRFSPLPYFVIYKNKKTKKYNTDIETEIPKVILSNFFETNPPGNGVIGIYMINVKKKNKVSRSIDPKISEKVKKGNCVSCGTRSDLVCDHKNDFYNDFRLNSLGKQLESDFQCLCNHCNLQKRQICKDEHENKQLYSAKNIDRYKVYPFAFPWELNAYNPNDPFCKVGTYWYDPVEFEKNIFYYSSYVLPVVKAIKKLK